MSRAEFIRKGEFGILRSYREGVQLYGQGSYSGEAYLIKSGAMKLVCAHEDGREAIVGLRFPGSFIGAESIIGRRPNSASAITLRPSVMEQIPSEDLLQRICTDSSLAIRILESHSRDILEQAEDLTSLAMESAKMRFVRLVRKLAQSLDDVCLPDGRLNLPLKKKDLAAILAIDPAHLSRLLNDMTNDGLITFSKQWIVISDRRAFMD